jgi:RNA ligase (TIGR02306 family)
MSTFAVTVETIARIERHPQADRLDLASLRRFPDWRFVVARDSFQVGDLGIYFPIDSVLPPAVITALGLHGKLAGAQGNRVKTVRLRGEFSQGICARPSALLSPERAVAVREGTDLTAELGVEKYEPPPVPCQHGTLAPLPAQVELLLDSPVLVMEKLEGSHIAVQRRSDGAVHVCQRNHRIVPDPDGGTHDWYTAARAAGIQTTLAQLAPVFPGQALTLRGEVLGPGVQGNWYRLPALTVRVFELEAEGQAVDAARFLELMASQPTPIAPLLARGVTLREWLAGRSLAEASTGPSALSRDPAKPVLREGIVIRPMHEQRHPELGRVILKKRSPVYLAGNEW